MKRKRGIINAQRMRRLRPALIALLALTLAASTITSAMAYRAAEVITQSHTIYALTQRTQLSYLAAVKPSVIYDNATVIGPGKPLYTRLIEAINITYEHSTQPLVADLVREWGTYDVVMTLSSGRGWSKTVMLVPATSYEGTYSGTVVISISDINNLIERLEQETGLSSSTYTLTVDVETDSTLLLSGVGEVTNNYVSSAVIELRLGEGRMSIKTKGTTSEVSKDESISQENTLKILGREVPVTDARKYSTVALVTSMMGLLAITLYPGSRRKEPDRKYRDIIIDGEPRWLTTLPVVEVKKLKDLVDLARGSGKPVIRSTKDEGGATTKTYTLLDGGVIYVHKEVQPRQN